MPVYMEMRNGKPTGVWIVEVTVNRKRMPRVRCQTKQEGLKVEQLIKAGLYDFDNKDVRSQTGYTLGHLMNDERMLKECWPTTDRDRHNSMRRFRECCEIIGTNVLLSDLKTEHIDELIEELEKRPARKQRTKRNPNSDKQYRFRVKHGLTNPDNQAKTLAPATINRYLAALSEALDWANTRESTGFLGKRNTIHFSWRDERGNEREHWLTPEEEIRIVEYLRTNNEDPRPDVATVVQVLCATGCRVGEILKLKPDAIDPLDETIRLDRKTTKGKKTRYQPLDQALCIALRNLKTSGKMPSYKVIQRQFYRARKACKVECADITLHGLRHTVGTQMQIAGFTIEETAQFLGHSSTRVTERYQHAALQQKRLTLAKLKVSKQQMLEANKA